LRHLGIDIGGTASRWVLCDGDGQERGRGAAGGATGHVFNPVERQRLQAALTAIAAAAGGGIDSVTLGLTGYGAVVADEVTGLLGATFGVGPERLLLVDDIMLAYTAVFAPGEGHLVSAGTGSVGLHLGGALSYVRVGGRGILVDDAGSGSWIALRAVDRMFRNLDRTGSHEGTAALAREIFAGVGGSDWHAVRGFIYGADRGRIGTLATAVAAAARAGDAVALGVLADAGRELAGMAEALVARAGTRPVAFIGGVLALHPVIGETIATELAGMDLRYPKADAALAAARLQLPGGAAWREALGRAVGDSQFR
jgi:N-acetylglucosamine kinase-like BadF-type ATPase